MRIGLLLLCFYGLSPSAAHASTMSAEDLSPNYRIFLSSLRGRVLAEPSIALNRGDANGFLISSARSIKISPAADIRVNAKPSLLTAESITLLSGGNISLSGLAKKDLSLATLTPRISGGDITISGAGNIDAGRGNLSAKDITILTSGNISLGSGIRVPPISTIPSVGGEIVLSHGGDIITMSSVPLPASFTMLLTGLLGLVSISRRSLFSKG